MFYAAMSLHTLISAGTYIVAKGAINEFAPLVFAFYRFIFAALALAVIAVARGVFFKFERRHWPKLILLGILAVPINQCLFLYGLQFTLPTHPALLFATTPVWVYLFSIWKKEERMTTGKTTGILVALIGVISFFAEKGVSMKTDYLLGDGIILVAVLAWAAYTVVGRSLVREKGAFAVTSSTLILGTIIYFPLGFYLALTFDYSAISWVGWSGVAYTALLTSVLAYTIWQWGIKHMEPSRTAIFMNMQPIVTALLAYYLLDERLSAGSVVFGAVILLGVFLVQRENSHNVV